MLKCVLKCVLSEKPRTDLTLTELSPASPRARLSSGFRILGIPCCPGCQPHTRIHTTFPPPVLLWEHQPKQRHHQMVWVPRYKSRMPLSGMLSGCSSGTHNPLLRVLSPLGCVGSFPRRRKFRLEQNNCKHRCGHSTPDCRAWGRAPAGCAT